MMGVGGLVSGFFLALFGRDLLDWVVLPAWLKMTWPYLVIVFVYVPMFFWIRRVSRKLRNFTLGMKGEQVVARELEAMRQDGYHVFHSLVMKKFDIDHVLIGPTGVYAVETKTLSKKGGREEKIVYDGKKILINGFASERDATRQAGGNAKIVHDLLLNETGINVWVTPMVVYPGWYVMTTTPDPKVLVQNQRMIRSTLNKRPIELDGLTIDRLSKALAEHQGEIYEGQDI